MMMLCRKCGREVEPSVLEYEKVPVYVDVHPRQTGTFSTFFVCDPFDRAVGSFTQHPETWHEGVDVFFLRLENALEEHRTVL